jgi:hypothetical protein
MQLTCGATRENLDRMLHRPHSRGVILISQPAHAWISGQIARLWGNKEFGVFAPRTETELAAELHDLGFAKWEERPTLDRASGLPHTFLNLPLAKHLDIWSEGIHEMMRYGRYPALLVSMHYSWLCQMHPHYESPQHAMLVQEFLDTQAAFQTVTSDSLRRDPHLGQFSDARKLLRNRQLISAWDYLSLLICGGIKAPQQIENVPNRENICQLTLQPDAKNSTAYFLTPWPFQAKQMEFVCEGRLLRNKYSSLSQFRAALPNAEPVALKFRLLPG